MNNEKWLTLGACGLARTWRWPPKPGAGGSNPPTPAIHFIKLIRVRVDENNSHCEQCEACEQNHQHGGYFYGAFCKKTPSGSPHAR